MACLMTFFSAAAGKGSVTLRLMQPVPVFTRGYLALNSAMWWAPLVCKEALMLLIGQGNPA
jgi:hypothetical protein